MTNCNALTLMRILNMVRFVTAASPSIPQESLLPSQYPRMPLHFLHDTIDFQFLRIKLQFLAVF